MKLWIVILIFLSSLSLFAADPKNRVEELFIWKISDELKFSVPEEKTFSDLIRSLNQRRHAANEQLQSTLRAMAEAKTSKEREKLLVEHKHHLKTYNELTIEEVDQMQKLLGTDRTAKYLVLKNDLTNKLKTMLATPEKSAPAEKMAPPKLIEEK